MGSSRERAAPAKWLGDNDTRPGSAVKRFSLDEGSRVLVLEKRESFVKIRDGEGRDGWAKAEDLGEI